MARRKASPRFNPDQLNALLKGKLWTGADLARATGLSRQSVWYYLNGRMTPTGESLRTICKALGCVPGVLCERSVD